MSRTALFPPATFWQKHCAQSPSTSSSNASSSASTIAWPRAFAVSPIRRSSSFRTAVARSEPWSSRIDWARKIAHWAKSSRLLTVIVSIAALSGLVWRILATVGTRDLYRVPCPTSFRPRRSGRLEQAASLRAVEEVLHGGGCPSRTATRRALMKAFELVGDFA